MKDENFKGSIFEKMGFEEKLCDKCNAHLRNGICLNGCHLSKRTLKIFQITMEALTERRKR